MQEPVAIARTPSNASLHKPETEPTSDSTEDQIWDAGPECSICYSSYDNTFKTPKILECNHTFCLECLSRFITISPEKEGSQITCPLCRKPTSVPENGPPALTTSLEVLGQLPSHQQQENNVWLDGMKLCYSNPTAPDCICIDIGSSKQERQETRQEPRESCGNRLLRFLGFYGDWKRLLIFIVLLLVVFGIILWPIQSAMDDLDHSVLIAERDWDDFYEESEECSIQQAQLAGLDDSGLSDTDDEKTSTQEPVVSLQTNSEKPDEEHDTAAQTLSTADDCEVGNPSDKSECLSHKTDLEQTRQTILNDNATRLTSNSGVNDNRTEDQQNNNASDTETVQEHEQVTDKPIAISTFHAASSEGETFTKVMEISATPKQEKERWFVTVNDSPVQQRVYSVTQGQKKRRKKKNSKKTGHRDRVMEGQCPRSSSEKEAEGEKNTKGHYKGYKIIKHQSYCDKEVTWCLLYKNKTLK
ncbi:hypothetical protein NFI96_009607 [Prochilodus magdalenae]|nr:hypothetical protein NFI96_009607 [Prochilodus magdalenae]